MELMTIQFGLLNLGSSEKSESSEAMTEVLVNQIESLTLGPSKSSKSARKSKCTLEPKLKAILDRFMERVPVACDPPLFPEPQQVCGTRRRLDEFDSLPEQSNCKRREVETQHSSYLHSLDLDDFERAQTVLWKKYINESDGRDRVKPDFNFCPGTGRLDVRFQSYDWQIERVTPTFVQKTVKCLSSSQQIIAYRQLLRDAEISSIPQYQALFTRKLEKVRQDTMKQSETHKMEQRKLNKAQHMLRCDSSLGQKALKENICDKDTYVMTIRCRKRQLEDGLRRVERSFKQILRSRRTENGFLELIEKCQKRFQNA